MLTVVIVNWNVRDALRACVQSLERHPASRHPQRIIVVDNASTDDSVAMLRAEFPAVHLVTSARNLGYGGGNNLGLACAEQLDAEAGQPALAQARYFLILNPDTEVTPGALDALLDYADAHPDAGIIGPQLRYADGAPQSSRRRFPTLATALFESTWLQPLAPRRLLDRYYMRDRRDDETCDVDWVVGAAMLARREAYLQAGGFDEQTFFMYSEEIDWCRRIKQAGWRVVYHPQAVIVHHEARSSAQVSARRMIYFNTSKVRYFARHHGPLQAGVLRVALLSLFAEQLLLEGAKWLIGHRRPLRAERLAAYRAVLRSGLR